MQPLLLQSLGKMLPKQIFEDILEKVKNNIAQSKNPHFRMSGRSDKCFFREELDSVDWLPADVLLIDTLKQSKFITPEKEM